MGAKDSASVAVSVVGAGLVRFTVRPAPAEMDETVVMLGVIWMVGATGATTVTVAVTAAGGMPAALNVMAQEWLPSVALAGFNEAERVAGVEPDVADKVSQEQSEPSAEVKAMPLDGLVLASEIV